MQVLKAFAATMVVLAAVFGAAAASAQQSDPEAVAISAYDDYLAGRIDPFLARADPEMRTAEVRKQLAEGSAFHRSFLKTPPTASWIVGWHTFEQFDGSQSVTIRREYDYGDRAALLRVTLRRDSAKAPFVLENFTLDAKTKESLAVNNFTFKNRSPVHFLILAAMILSPLTCLFALVSVIRAPKFGWKKWAYALFTLVTVGQTSFNWTTGGFEFQPIFITILGANGDRGASLFDPWIVSFTLPIGALFGLARARRARREAAAAAAAAAPIAEATGSEPAG